MVVEAICPVSGETHREERINYLTHFAGFIFSCVAACLLIGMSFSTGNFWRIFSSVVYGSTLVLLYASSAYYHRCKVIHHKRTLRIVDHACIYLLIAGTYTPIGLIPLSESGGHVLLMIEWGIAALGVIFKILAIERFRILSTLAYLGMGWLVVFALPTLVDELSFSALFWLVSGGVIYSLGVIFYVWESLPFNHGIWHLFVLGGSACHFLAIYEAVLLME